MLRQERMNGFKFAFVLNCENTAMNQHQWGARNTPPTPHNPKAAGLSPATIATKETCFWFRSKAGFFLFHGCYFPGNHKSEGLWQALPLFSKFIIHLCSTSSWCLRENFHISNIKNSERSIFAMSIPYGYYLAPNGHWPSIRKKQISWEWSISNTSPAWAWAGLLIFCSRGIFRPLRAGTAGHSQFSAICFPIKSTLAISSALMISFWLRERKADGAM